MPNGTAYEFPDAPEAGPAGVPAVIVEKAKADALAIPDRVAALVVMDQDSLDEANDYLNVVRERINFFKNLYDARIAEADSIHKGLLADRNGLTKPLIRAKDVLDGKIADYLYEEDQKRLAKERERQLVEEKARREAEKAADKAHELIQKGQEAKADALIDKATERIEAALAAAPAVPEKPLADYRLTQTWDIEITNADLVPREYCVPDEVRLRRIVKANAGRMEIPGVRIFQKRSVASKAGKY
jgi:hypothetical protein